MNNDLINGKAALLLFNQDESIEFVINGEWFDLSNSNLAVTSNMTEIFRVKPTSNKDLTLLREIQANRITLDNCPQHKFEVLNYGEKNTCIVCNGKLSVTEIGQYVQGFAAAGGNPCDILNDWFGTYMPTDLVLQRYVTCPDCNSVPDKVCIRCNSTGSLMRKDFINANKA